MKLIVFSHATDKLKINGHLAPPSNEMLEHTILAACYFCGIKADGGILFHDLEPSAEYAMRVAVLGKRFGMTVLNPKERVGYRRAYLAVAHYVRECCQERPREVYLHLEHDWHFTKRIPTGLIAEWLTNCSDAPVDYIRVPNYHDELERFRGHPCAHFELDEDRRGGGPCMRDTLWSSNPHFSRFDKLLEWGDYVRDHNIEDNSGNGMACGVDWPLCKAYLDDIKRMGFDDAHVKWGVWLLLNNGGFDRMVEHVGV